VSVEDHFFHAFPRASGEPDGKAQDVRPRGFQLGESLIYTELQAVSLSKTLEAMIKSEDEASRYE
jgi:hypothetical protein